MHLVWLISAKHLEIVVKYERHSINELQTTSFC